MLPRANRQTAALRIIECTPAADYRSDVLFGLSDSARAEFVKVVFDSAIDPSFTRYSYPPYTVTHDGQLFLVNAPAQPDPLTLIQLPRR